MSNTGRTQITAEATDFYNRSLLERATPAFVHNRFCQVKDIPANSGTNVIKFRRYGVLTAQTTALTTGVTPAGTALSVTDVTATVARYGDYITLDDEVLTETIDPLLSEAADILGDQAGLSLDTLCRDVMAAGTTIQYASTAVSDVTVTAAMKFTRDEAKEAVRTLRGNLAKPIKTMINPTTGYNTTPVGNSFIGICSEDTAYDIEDATGFIPVEKYPSQTGVMPDEIGALGNIRFIMTTNAKINAAAGATSNDVHYTIILGQDAVAQSRISGHALQNIVKPLGSAGSADPLDQRTTSGWKASYVAKIINQLNLVVVRHGVTA